MYLDPISLLGADTPWADMGVLYEKKDSGVEKLCYCAVTPDIAQAPSGTNVFVPGATNTKKKEKYAMFYGEGMDLMTDEQRNIAQAVVSAIFQSPEFGFLKQLMTAKQEESGNGGPSQPGVGQPLPTTGTGGSPLDMGEEDKVAYSSDSDENNESSQESYDDDFGSEDDVTEGSGDEEYAEPVEDDYSLADEVEGLGDETGDEDTGEDYDIGDASDEADVQDSDDYNGEEDQDDLDFNFDNAESDDLDEEPYYEENDMDAGRAEDFEKRIHRLEVLLNDALKKSTTQERYSKLSDLRQRYLFDMDNECEKCAYAKMSDAEFEDHLGEIERNYRKNPNYIEVPSFITQSAPQYSGDRPGAVKYSKEQSDNIEAEVMKIARHNAMLGKFQPAEEIREEVSRKFGNIQ